MISERPATVLDRAVPGHWEGDLIVGLNSSAIGTLVERKTRFTLLLHLPPQAGHGVRPREKNGPALAGHGAEAVRNAIAKTITSLPNLLRKSLTWDQGAEMSQHARLRIATGLMSISAIPEVHGNVAQTKTPTVSSDNTFRRARISVCTAPVISNRSR
jgi:IS30 family transposase